MNNADAKSILLGAVLNKVTESRFCFCERHTVQVQFSLNAVSTTSQLAHRSSAHVLAVETQRTSMAVFNRVNVVGKAFHQDGLLVRPGKFGSWLWFYFVFGNTLVGLESLRTRHGAEKCFFVVVSHGG